ncbi:MAG: SCP2 sterol-binding domain-containing protein [Archaeoglobaceae archaeon]
MTVVYPSLEWMNEVLKKVNSDQELKKVAANWEGDYLCRIEVDEEALRDLKDPERLAGFIAMLATIPVEKWDKFKGRPEEKFLNKLGIELDPDKLDITKLNAEELAKKVAELKIDDVKGAATYIWMDFWHGELRNMEFAAPGEHGNAKFKLIGTYGIFKQLITGKADPISLVVNGKLKLQGDIGYMMRNMNAVRKFMELMSSIPIR